MSAALRHHGGNLAAARAVYGDGAWIDLSTGITPLPWPVPPDLDWDWHGLPQPAALAALEAAAAGHFGVNPAFVCALPGSEIGLRLLGMLLGGRALHRVPGYRTHGAMFATSTPLASETPSPPVDAALILANPNNPCGTLQPRPALDAQLREREVAGGWLIVDEAFVDAHPDASIAGQVTPENRLIVFRSFGKFFGLAGLRLGFVIAPPPIIAAYRRALGDWPIGTATLEIATRAYRDRRWIAASRIALADHAARLDALLRRHGLAPMGACPLFRLVEVEDAAPCFDRLARAHILTRPFDYAPHWLRFGLPADEAAFDRLDRALAHG